MNKALGITLGVVASAVVVALGTFGIVKHVKHKNFRAQFPSSFSDKDIRDFVTLEEGIKLSLKSLDGMTEGKREQLKREIAFTIADTVYCFEKKQIESHCDMGKAIIRINKLAKDYDIDFMKELKIVCRLYASTSDAVATIVMNKYKLPMYK